MIVVDASALVYALTDFDQRGEEARGILSMHREWAGPAHVCAEALQTFRGLLFGGELKEEDAEYAVRELVRLQINLFIPDAKTMPRAWELRHNLTMYDALYVALAEDLECELLTADARIARSNVARCEIVTIGG